MDRLGELETILAVARELKIRPVIGVRARLSTTRRRQVGGVDRRPLEVRPHHGRDRGRRRAAARGGHARLPAAPPLPHRLPDHRRSARSRTRCGKPAASSSSCTRSAPTCASSTAAAASASTTTAAGPTSTPRSTTRSRSTRPTSSARSPRPATPRACRIPTSSPSRAARSWRTTRCWSSTCSAPTRSCWARSPSRLARTSPV